MKLLPVTDKSGKRRKQNSEIQDSPDPFELMRNYFDKRFEGIEKLQHPSNKNPKIEDILKFKHKGNSIQFEFNQKILQMVENLSSTLNNDDISETNDHCDDLTAKLKRRNKLIKVANRSVLDWDTVAMYEADPIASDSDDGKEIRQAENRAFNKRKSKTSNKLTLSVPSQKPSGQQFRIDGEHNGFTPLSQRNFNFRFPSSNFTQDGYYRRSQWPSSLNVRSGDTCFGCGERGNWRKYFPKFRHRN